MKRATSILLLVILTIAAWGGEPAKNFTAMEINHIRVKTPGLFSAHKSFSLHLDDIKTKANDTIRCIFDGVVRMAKPYAAYGNVVVVRHTNGLESVYSHNSRNLVKSGDVVKAGTPLALTGRTGRATTEHLHLEFRIDGQHFNPSLVLDLKDRTLRKDKLICTKLGNRITVKSKLINKQ